MYAIIDIDETLTMKRQEKMDLLPDMNNHTLEDWDEWNNACADDIPRSDTINMVRTLNDEGYTIIMLTARGEATHYLTNAWLQANEVPYHMLITRAIEWEALPSAEYKTLAVERHLGGFGEVAMVMDDNGGVCEAFAAKGVVPIHITPMEA